MAATAVNSTPTLVQANANGSNVDLDLVASVVEEVSGNARGAAATTANFPIAQSVGGRLGDVLAGTLVGIASADQAARLNELDALNAQDAALSCNNATQMAVALRSLVCESQPTIGGMHAPKTPARVSGLESRMSDLEKVVQALKARVDDYEAQAAKEKYNRQLSALAQKFNHIVRDIPPELHGLASVTTITHNGKSLELNPATQNATPSRLEVALLDPHASNVTIAHLYAEVPAEDQDAVNAAPKELMGIAILGALSTLPKETIQKALIAAKAAGEAATGASFTPQKAQGQIGGAASSTVGGTHPKASPAIGGPPGGSQVQSPPAPAAGASQVELRLNRLKALTMA